MDLGSFPIAAMGLTGPPSLSLSVWYLSSGGLQNHTRREVPLALQWVDVRYGRPHTCSGTSVTPTKGSGFTREQAPLSTSWSHLHLSLTLTRLPSTLFYSPRVSTLFSVSRKLGQDGKGKGQWATAKEAHSPLICLCSKFWAPGP